jgi:hypothetical protein
MTHKRFGLVFLLAAAIGLLPRTAFADEIVHFTNGAEMTVRSHSVEQTKQMVKLDLGGNSFISFPMSMVDKIVSAGRDVFLNPVFHPANQAIAGAPGNAVTDNSIRGTGEPAGPGHRSAQKGTQGAMLGEATDAAVPIPAGFGQIEQQVVANSRRAFNPAFPPTPGSPPQVITLPGRPQAPVQMMVVPTSPPQQPPAQPPPVTPPNNDTQDSAPSGDPAPEDPPDTP